MEEQKDQRPSDETVIEPAEEEAPAVAEETVIAPDDGDEALEGIAGLAPADDVLGESADAAGLVAAAADGSDRLGGSAGAPGPG